MTVDGFKAISADKRIGGESDEDSTQGKELAQSSEVASTSS